MKGIVFNLPAEVVAHEHGEDAWDDLPAAAGFDGAYIPGACRSTC